VPGNDRLPDYAPMLADYHAAYADELQAMIASLPIAPGDRVLDLACGDGAYAGWLAGRVGPSGVVCAVDLLPAFLDRARARTRRQPLGKRVQYVNADVERLPFPDDAFDLAWCAQSLYSLPDPVATLRTMRRVVRDGGTVAVLENDTMHHILLPWPVEVELAVRRAELLAYAQESDAPRKFYLGRQLCQAFRAAGLVDCRKRTWATNRQAPLGPRERGFLEKTLLDLRERALPHLEPAMAARFERLVDPRSDEYLLDGPDLSVTCIDHVVWGTKPSKSLTRGSGARAIGAAH
jgi:ubiquinone/menaquinone biosynthesis C-methylase UbiE